MEQKEQTALMRAIQRAKDTHNYYVDESLKDNHTEREQELLYIKSIALAEVIDTLAELLPVERKQGVDMFMAGNLLGDNRFKNKNLFEEAESYFNNTYTQE